MGEFSIYLNRLVFVMVRFLATLFKLAPPPTPSPPPLPTPLHTHTHTPVVVLLVVPRLYLCCSSSLFVRRWFDMWRLFNHLLFLISSSFGVSERLCFVIGAFLGVFTFEPEYSISYNIACAPSKYSNAQISLCDATGLPESLLSA